MAQANISGLDMIRNPRSNKGSAFSLEERQRYGLQGLLPPNISSQADQIARSLKNLRRKTDDIERYIFLSALQNRNERLFYQLVIENIEELMPIIYTPTVGQACQEFADIFRQSQGLYVTAADRGKVRQILANWPHRDVRLIVVTDGERILGLGDLGANGMGIPIGKLALYSACAGVPPQQCLPIMLDVGTNNEQLRKNPLYLGLKQPRIEGQAYLDLVEEFVVGVQDVFPGVLIQFEDFLTPNAYRLLEIYRERVLCFNDDIQGTAAVALAGVIASTRVSHIALKDTRIMFLGAGSAATGIADLIHVALCDAGLCSEEAYRRLWFVDLHGLVVKSRQDLAPHNLPYAHDREPLGFKEAVAAIKPQVLIGATGAPGTFTREIVSLMAELNERPAIFALSNPTSRAECTAEQAYQWSGGRALFASGSPFASVEYDGKTYKPGQGNNAYVFPGIGLGALASRARLLTDEMFLVAADCLAQQVSDRELQAGSLYPPLTDIRAVSKHIAKAVAEVVYARELSDSEAPADIMGHIESMMYDSSY